MEPSYTEKVAEIIKGKMACEHFSEALNIVGDTSEYETEGLTPEEAAEAICDAAASSL